MTHYAHRIRAHWERYAPNRMKTLVASSEDLEALCSEIGVEVLGEVSSLSEDMARVMLAEMPEAREDYLTQVALLTTARKIAEEIAMTHQLAWMSDPSLTLAEARQEWEDTRPMDEGLADLALQAQLSDYPIYSTEEMEELAKEWAVPVEFLNQMFEAEIPYRFMMEHQDVMAEAATIRFLREVG